MKQNLIVLLCITPFLNGMEQNTFNKESFSKAYAGFADQTVRAMEQSDDDGLHAVNGLRETYKAFSSQALQAMKKNMGILAINLTREIQEDLLGAALEANDSESVCTLLKDRNVDLGTDKIYKYFRKTSPQTREEICKIMVEISDTPQGKANLTKLTWILAKLSDEVSFGFLQGAIHTKSKVLSINELEAVRTLIKSKEH